MKTLSAREQAFNKCIERSRGILLRISGDFARPVDRDDLLQEMMMALWHALPNFAGRASESTFVYRVALNTALSWHRGLPAAGMALDEIGELPGVDTLPLDHLLDAERSGALESAIHQLQAIDRALLRLYLDGQPYRAIGDILGLTESNVGARLSRARQRLARILKGAST